MVDQMTVAISIEGFDLSEADKTLAARFACGKSGVLEEVTRLYQGRVARLAQRLLGWNSDADDIVQDLFLDALLGASRFRTDASLWTWLSTITVNRCGAYVTGTVVQPCVPSTFTTPALGLDFVLLDAEGRASSNKFE
jgi:DNA-directed RNA polymerase specialized sigma24 family protein